MHTVSFDYKGKPRTYRAPRNWNQLTAVQLIRWAAVAFGSFNQADQLRLALLIGYGFEPKVFAHLKDHYKAQLSHTVRFLFTDNKLTRWLLPSFRIGLYRYYGPADHLSNLSCHEFFNYTEQLYQQWLKKPQESALNVLCAVLYRQKCKGEVNDDIRQPLTDAGVSLRAKRFESLNLSVKQAILLNYEGCRRSLIDRFPEVFQESNGKALRLRPQAADLVLALAGPQLGTYKEAKETNLYKFLEHASNMIRQAEEAKAA
jgi:hypothetical protein